METTKIIPVYQAHRGEYGCDSCDATDVPRLYLIKDREALDLMLCDACKLKRDLRKGEALVKAIYNVVTVVPRQDPPQEEREETEEEHRAFVEKIAGMLSGRGYNVHSHVPVTWRIPIGTPYKFELASVEIAACTLCMVSEACDYVENMPAFSKLTIIPPVEGTSKFTVTTKEDGVTIDLPALKKALVEALEAMV